MTIVNYVHAITMHDRMHQAIVEGVNRELFDRGMKTRAMSFNTKPTPSSLLVEFHGPTDEAGDAGRIFNEVKLQLQAVAACCEAEWLVVEQVAG